jgi:hypothetical protein
MPHPLRLGTRFENVHPDDQPVLEAIMVANPGVRDELAGARIADYLMHIDGDAAVGFLGKALRFYRARDRLELSVPVVANRRAADHPTALPGVRPIHLRVHELDRGVEIAGVERAVGGPQRFLSAWHAIKLAGETSEQETDPELRLMMSGSRDS